MQNKLTYRTVPYQLCAKYTINDLSFPTLQNPFFCFKGAESRSDPIPYSIHITARILTCMSKNLQLERTCWVKGHPISVGYWMTTIGFYTGYQWSLRGSILVQIISLRCILTITCGEYHGQVCLHRRSNRPEG